MSAAKHTPGPWRQCGGFTPAFGGIHSAAGYIVYGMADRGIHTEQGEPINAPGSDEQFANRRLIATSPELLAAVEAQYIELADIRNEWPGRATIAGQERLCRLRDLICKATGREPQDVQDDYGNRALTKNSEATP